MKTIAKVITAILNAVWCLLDVKGYCEAHYTKEELDEMGIDFDYR
jgi:hypothetical protein